MGLMNRLRLLEQRTPPTLSAAEIAVLDGVTAGTVVAGKAVVAGANGNITALGNLTGAKFTGPVTGAVTGNVTGIVTGNVTGNITGNLSGTDVTASGNVTAGLYKTGASSGATEVVDIAVKGNLTFTNGLFISAAT